MNTLVLFPKFHDFLSENSLFLKELHLFMFATTLTLCPLHRGLQYILTRGYESSCQMIPCSAL